MYQGTWQIEQYETHTGWQKVDGNLNKSTALVKARKAASKNPKVRIRVRLERA